MDWLHLILRGFVHGALALWVGFFAIMFCGKENRAKNCFIMAMGVIIFGIITSAWNQTESDFLPILGAALMIMNIPVIIGSASYLKANKSK